MTYTQPKPDFHGTPFRLLVAACIGSLAAVYCLASMSAKHSARLADDFTWHWLAARALLARQNPYEVIHAGGQYALDAPYLYPLTTAIAAIPFAGWLSPIVAATAFVGVSTTLLAWGLTRDGYEKLPLFLSIPFLWACTSGQPTPLLAASALLPALAWLAPIKPNLGLATVAYRPSPAATVGSIGFIALAIIINPNWIREWIAILPQRIPGIYRPPASILPGPLILLALLRWRRPEARLLAVLSLVPQNFLFYDQLLLWLIPTTWRQSQLLSASSIVALFLANSTLSRSPDVREVGGAYAPVIITMLYLPCLVMVLQRPNEGELPDWIARIVKGIRRRIPSHF
jgi:hypothetical protein